MNTTHPIVEANSAQTNEAIDILAGILGGYGESAAAKALLVLDDSQGSCGLAERTTITSEFAKFKQNTKDTPCNTEPYDAQGERYFYRDYFNTAASCESTWDKGSCEACGFYGAQWQYPYCREVKKLWMHAWNSAYCQTCVPNCPAPLSHPMGTWNYILETESLPIGAKIIENVKEYYTKCVSPPSSTEDTIASAIKQVATKVVAMACPECYMAYEVAMEAKPMVEMFNEIGNMDTYIQNGDHYGQGKTLGKILKVEVDLIADIDSIALLNLDKDTHTTKAQRKQLGGSFMGEAKIDDTVMVDQDETVDGRKAYELFLEGLNYQFSAPENYDFNECLAKFYTNELELLDQHLQSIRRDLDSETGSDLVHNLKAINNLYLSADTHCSDIMVSDRVEQMNTILDEFTLEFRPMNRSEGLMQPEVKLVSSGATIDISDEMYALSAKSQLIQKAQEQGNFGGNINGWHKLGQSQGVILTLFTMDVDEQLGNTSHSIAPWAIGGGLLLSLIGVAACKRYRSKKTHREDPEQEDDSMNESLNNEQGVN